MHPRYLPFTEAQLAEHFAPVVGSQPVDHLAYYREQARRIAAFESAPPPSGPEARRLIRAARQIEKDERFWTVAALMGLFHSENRVDHLTKALSKALGDDPPLGAFSSWQESLAGPLHLFFEVGLPSPHSYRTWLRQHQRERHFIPYVLEAAEAAGESLEGRTHVDAVLLAEDSGFAVLFEAKVTSDASSQVSFDLMRNQLIRNIDVMLDANPHLEPPLNERDPDNSCFVLLTPELFQKRPDSRLYGRLLLEYQGDPEALARDLPHRPGLAWPKISKRLGWLSFEECHRIEPTACPWLATP